MAAGAPTYATFDSAPTPPAHPLASASWLSRCVLGWVTPLITLGNEKQLGENDVWPLQWEQHSAALSATFAQASDCCGSLPRAFVSFFGWRVARAGVALFAATVLTFAGPIVLNHVVAELTLGEYDILSLATWICGLLATQLIQALAENYSNFEMKLIAIELTAALKSLIYNKTLKLDADSRKVKSTGDITNLCKSDCEMIFVAVTSLHQMWIIPLQVIAAGAMLYDLLGLASLAGFAVIGLTFAINHYFSAQLVNMYLKTMKCKDERIKVVTEVFKAISTIKFNAWEDQFLERIHVVRTKELDTIWKFMTYIALSVMMTWGLPVFVSVTTFGVYSGLLHQRLNATVVFTSLALFQLVQVPLRYVSRLISCVVKATVAEARMGEFLALPELDNDSILTINSPHADAYLANNVIVAVENATFAWSKDAIPVLRNVDLQILAGEFVVVHGPVGCGKSSLCAALLGDMFKTHGTAYVGGSIAYCSQQPWIQHASVRDNILFGRPFNRHLYGKVIEACALATDLESLPAGDRTEIGERGVNLSGGQKARVALARACYSDASVYILDAPLAAVDAIVQNEIFEKCMLGLLRHRTILLVTHSPEIIASHHVTRVVTVDKNGGLAETRAAATSRPAHASLLTPLPRRAYTKAYENVDNSGVTHERDDRDAPSVGFSDMAIGTKSPFHERVANSSSHDDDYRGTARDTAQSDETHRLIDDEERHQGRVGSHVFTAYYRAIGGFPVLFLILMSQVLWQGLQISSDFWLSDWASDAISSGNELVSTSSRIWIYTLLGVTAAVMVLGRTVAVSYFGLRAATNMFDQMTHALLHAPMRFFDANPIGRILIRYSNDVYNVDFTVPVIFGGFLAEFFSVASMLAVAIAIVRWRGLLLLPVMFAYERIASLYLQPARDVERVLNTTEAPILSHLSESIEGGAVIRAFGSQQLHRFQLTNSAKLDTANKVRYARLAISQWFGLRIQMLSAVLVFIVAVLLVLLHSRLSVAVIGLVFSYVLKISISMERTVQSWSTVETNMISPERMQQYIHVEQEAPHSLPASDPLPSSGWPATGAIDFRNVSFRYKESDRCVLNNLNLSIAGGEKVGIVGRTGAGKSSLTMALFRINEVASGTIWIDGVDVGTIGLKTLRSKMSIIPQNPTFFKGPLRKCLDPFDEFHDDQLWRCLRQVGLSDRVSRDGGQLACAVEHDGDNFSVGERQLLCLARALLCDARIVVLDEATAAVDHAADRMLQRVVREAFGSATVLTIAHRLDTVLDADRILVLDHGAVVAFAPPAQLVQSGEGPFFDLVREGGYLDAFLANAS